MHISHKEELRMKTLSLAEFQKDPGEHITRLREIAKGLKDGVLRDEVIGIIDKAETLLKVSVEEAYGKYIEVIEKIDKAKMSSAAEALAMKLAMVEFAQLIFLVALAYATYKWPDFELWDGIVNYSTQSAWAGAMGGVTVALWGLYKHIQDRDFDPKYKLWYLLKPVMGGIFGWIVFLIYYVGFLSVQGMEIEDIKRPEMFVLVAFLAGFSENFTIKVIYKIMRTLIDVPESSSTSGEKKK
jgi:hypothetical protein